MLPSTRPRPEAPPSGSADLALVRAARGGERAAVERLLERLGCIGRFVFRLDRLLGYGLEPSQLDDVVQQVYATVWPRLGDFAGCAALESWVYGFCRNCVRAEARRRAHALRLVLPSADLDQRAAAGAGPEPGRALTEAERADALWAELERLAPSEREVVVLRHVEELSFEEIARRRGVPVSTVKDRCYRALAKLKGRLERRDVDAS